MENKNTEIMAAIAAAIASIETQSGIKLVVRSMRRVPQSSPIWSATGRLESLGILKK